MAALTQIDLDAAGCEVPNCRHDHTVLFLKGVCHPSAGNRAAYDKRTKSLKLHCRRCEKIIAEIAVAAGLPIRPDLVRPAVQ
jgi:hypothetical protein